MLSITGDLNVNVEPLSLGLDKLLFHGGQIPILPRRRPLIQRACRYIRSSLFESGRVILKASAKDGFEVSKGRGWSTNCGITLVAVPLSSRHNFFLDRWDTIRRH